MGGVSSCCCGWQNLNHGLFIFSVGDIIIRFLMVGVNMVTGASWVAGFNMFLMLADIGLGAGVKIHVPLLLLMWLVIFGIHIVISVIVPPLVILIGFTATTFFSDSVGGSSHYKFALHFVANIDSFKKSHAIFFANHIIVFLLGLFYIYIWVVVRSLFVQMGKVDYEGDDERVKVLDSRPATVSSMDSFPHNTNQQVFHMTPEQVERQNRALAQTGF